MSDHFTALRSKGLKSFVKYLYDPFCNSITKERTEVVLQGTRNKTIIPNGIWQEYEFKCKPGDISRRPCLISPYHYRLDWLMWFAAFMVCACVWSINT